MATFAVIALGCKVNQYDAALLAGRLTSLGLRRVQPDEKPDLCLVQTCGVTAQAARKSRRAIRDAARIAGRVIVAGCLASKGSAGSTGSAAESADTASRLVLSNVELTQAETTLANWLDHSQPVSNDNSDRSVRTTQAAGLGRSKDEEWISPAHQGAESDRGQRPATSPQLNIRPAAEPVKQKFPAPADSDGRKTRVDDEDRTGSTGSTGSQPGPDFPDRTRAFVKVQDGCDAGCSFCIVPRYRPTMRWRSARAVLDEVAGLVRRGFREVVLCGIFLGAYGRDTAVRRRWADADSTTTTASSPLVGLIDAVAATPGLVRVRLSSLEPGDVTADLLDLLARRPDRIAAHFHLPLQSGSDQVLRRMNRQYDVSQFLRAADRLHATLDQPAIVTDVVAGFPGETDADFEATLAVLARAGVANVHAFAFSPRPGTAASRWTDQFVPDSVIHDRTARLIELGRRLWLDYRRQFVGQSQRVIIEWPRPNDPDYRQGRVDRYFTVRFPLPAGPTDRVDPYARRVAQVRIVRVEPGAAACGELISIDE